VGVIPFSNGRRAFFIRAPARSLTGALNFMTKLEKAVIVFLILALGWFLGRFTEAIALGNIKF